MEIAPELQFKHYTLRDALSQLPADAVVLLDVSAAGEDAICCDFDNHVFNAEHTRPDVAAALRGSHWFDLHEWAARSPGDAVA